MNNNEFDPTSKERDEKVREEKDAQDGVVPNPVGGDDEVDEEDGKEVEDKIDVDSCEEVQEDDYDDSYDDGYDEYGSSGEKYGWYNGWSDDAIDDAFEGDPENTWNVD